MGHSADQIWAVLMADDFLRVQQKQRQSSTELGPLKDDQAREASSDPEGQNRGHDDRPLLTRPSLRILTISSSSHDR